MSDIPQDAAPNYAPNVVPDDASGNVGAAATASSLLTNSEMNAQISSDASMNTMSASTQDMRAATNAGIPTTGAAEPLPRESHLMLLEHKLAMMHAKFKTGERIVIDEFEQILGHIRAVL